MNVEHGEKKDQVGTGQRKAACLMFGYICEHFLMTRAELDAMKYRIDDLAREKGYAMGGVYVERAASAPAAFRALILAVTRHEASVIGVPSLLHLAGLGASPTDTRDYIEQCIATRVLIAHANTKTAAKTEDHGGGQDDESGPTTPP